MPSDAPSDAPSYTPSEIPSDAPSEMPSDAPSDAPSYTPSDMPSDAPSDMPSDAPSDTPSDAPSDMPSDGPSDMPSDAPSDTPSDAPSDMPSDAPSDTPSDAPTNMPSDAPSDTPIEIPSYVSTNMPSDAPSGGYIYSPATYSPTASGNGGGYESNVGIIVGAIAVVCFLLCVVKTRRQVHRATRTAPPATLDIERNSVVGMAEEQMARQELMLAKFHFQVVLEDKTNVNVISLRNDSTQDDATNDDTEAALEQDDDDASVIGVFNDHADILSSLFTLRRMLASWSRSPNEECSICLEGYRPGQTICVAKNTQCNHIFHEGCMEEWMKDHDRCPLCRENVTI